MKSPTQANKGRMSLSPPATIPRGPNLHTTIRSSRKSVTSNYSGRLSQRSAPMQPLISEKTKMAFSERQNYNGEKGNTIDEMIAELIKDLDVRLPVRLISNDRYLVGTRILSSVIENNTVMFRVGGGYSAFGEYINKYQDSEIARLQLKMEQTGDSLEKIVKRLIRNVKEKDKTFKR